MKINNPTKALALSLIAASTVLAQAPSVAPAQQAQPAAAVVAAPLFTEAQLLEEFGWYIGKRTGLAELNLSPVEAEQLSKGVLGALNGKDSPFEIQKIGPEMTEFIQKKQAAILDTIKNKNLAQDAAFFAKLKDNKNVVELPDGLRYEIENPGTGNPPKPSDMIRVNYTGSLIDGSVFDSSEKQGGKPLDIGLDKVIAGWTEGLQKIAKGGKMKLYVPPQLGYGDDGRPGIPPGSVLVFSVELLDINPSPVVTLPAATK
jgi:FKBP-type peptidyl-prolyl cis-trans isomerase